ncbi:MAG: LysR family transcriptional regulator [Flammeovirgaceae bacterium]
MEIRHLRLIKAIVDEGSIINASKVLFLTPSALSHQLKEAEAMVGAAIFHRVNKKLILTDIGKKLYDGAARVLNELGEMDLEVKQLIYGETGTIRLSTECYTSYYWLPPVIVRSKEKFPNVQIQLDVNATHYPLKHLLDGSLDLAIVSECLENDHIEYLPLFEDEMRVVVAKSHPWAQKEFLSPSDFKEETLIIHSEPLETVTVYTKVLQPAQIEPKAYLIMPLTEAAIELVKSDMGVTVMANWAYQPYQSPELKTLKVGAEGLHRMHYIARLKNRQYPSFYKPFMEFMREEIGLKHKNMEKA